MSTAAARLQARIDQRTLWDVEADVRELLAENARLTLNQARAAHDLDMWLELHETEKGSARVAAAREKLEGVGP